jgi:chaperonin GroES
MVEFKPLRDRVVVEPIETKRTTQGGILLPDNVEQNVKQSRVLFVGPGNYTSLGNAVGMTVSPGDVILHVVNGAEVNFDGKVYRILARNRFLL